MERKGASRVGENTPRGHLAPPWLQSAWIRRLRWHFDHYNEAYTGNSLRPPLFRISEGTSRLGEWDPRTRSIAISEHHILTHPWEEVLDTLRHEMAHQYVDEVLGAGDGAPHGSAFRRACHVLRSSTAAGSTASGLGRLEDSPDERDRMLTRIKELLALATSPNENEAANAVRMANKYLLKYNIDLAEVDADRRYIVRHLGRSSPRIQEYEYGLSTILQDHFFVQAIWTFSYDPIRNRPGRVLQILGTPENLEIAEYVYSYVLSVAAPLWDQYRKTHGAGRGRRRVTRLQYLAGLVRGLQDKLDRQRRELREEHGLVWLGDPALAEFFRHVNPRVRSASTTGVRRGEGYARGFEDGRNITLRRGVGGPNARRGRLLSGPES